MDRFVERLIDGIKEHYEEIPLPLEFERIVNNHLECLNDPTPEIYSNIKKSVIKDKRY